jgi:hypothetical protein
VLRGGPGARREPPRFALRDIPSLSREDTLSLVPRLTVGARLSSTVDTVTLDAAESGARLALPADAVEAAIVRAFGGRTLRAISARLAADRPGTDVVEERAIQLFRELVARGLCEPANPLPAPVVPEA